MSYRLEIGKGNEQELTRIIHERFQKSYLAFSDGQDNIDYIVHELRKNMKKIRAVLRLVRKVTTKDFYKKQNKTARDIARNVAKIRESYVLLETFKKIEKNVNSKKNNLFYPATFKTMEIRHQELANQLIREENFYNLTVFRLHRAENEIENLSINADGFEAFEDSLKKVYKRGRKTMKKAKEEQAEENFHEWRKRAKYLRYQLRILKNVWPEVLKGFINQLHELSDLLGDNHDLHDFKNQLHKVFHSMEYDEWLHEMDRSVMNLSDKKRKSAINLGEKIYAEKPKAFLKRIEKYWKVSCNEIEFNSVASTQ